MLYISHNASLEVTTARRRHFSERARIHLFYFIFFPKGMDRIAPRDGMSEKKIVGEGSSLFSSFLDHMKNGNNRLKM